MAHAVCTKRHSVLTTQALEHQPHEGPATEQRRLGYSWLNRHINSRYTAGDRVCETDSLVTRGRGTQQQQQQRFIQSVHCNST